MPLADVKTFAQQVDDTLAQERLNRDFCRRGSPALALFLAALGLYGLVNYNMLGRRRDFALRLALGAAPRSLMSAILREVILWVTLGTTLGIAIAVPLARIVQRPLFGIDPTDVQVLAGAAVTMAFMLSLPPLSLLGALDASIRCASRARGSSRDPLTGHPEARRGAAHVQIVGED